jgi:hypothetical protein
MTHQKLYNAFILVGIAALKEHNVSNLMCDIFVPHYVSSDGQCEVQNVVIDLHGPHHFMRNKERIKGGSVLKAKILNNEAYFYEYVSVH